MQLISIGKRRVSNENSGCYWREASNRTRIIGTMQLMNCACTATSGMITGFRVRTKLSQAIECNRLWIRILEQKMPWQLSSKANNNHDKKRKWLRGMTLERPLDDPFTDVKAQNHVFIKLYYWQHAYHLSLYGKCSRWYASLVTPHYSASLRYHFLALYFEYRRFAGT